MSINPVARKKRGRPATGETPHVSIRLSEPVLAAVDRWADKNGAENRSEAIRRILTDYLKRRGLLQ